MRIGKTGALAVAAGALALSMAASGGVAMLRTSPMVNIPAGEYVPFFQESPGKGKGPH